MGEWSDRELELGYVDLEGNILIDDNPSEYDSDREVLESIYIDLTPSKYLDSKGRYLRSKLTNNNLSDTEINLEVMQDKYNEKDSLALQVFCNQTDIGYIQKYNGNENIDEFCFIENEKVKNLSIKWENNCLLLTRKLTFTEKKAIELTIREEKRKINDYLIEKNRLKAEEELKEKERIKEDERIRQEEKTRLAMKYQGSEYSYLDEAVGMQEIHKKREKQEQREEKIDEFIDDVSEAANNFFQPIIDFFLKLIGWGFLLFIAYLVIVGEQ